MEHYIALLTPTLVARVPASSDQKSLDTMRHAFDQGPHPSWPNCSPQLAESIGGRGGGGGHPCLRPRLIFDPKHAQLGSCLDSELASPWPQHPGGPKRLPCHVLYGTGHCLGRTQNWIPRDLDVPIPVHGSIHHDQLTPPPMVNCTPCHDWWATISIIRLDAGINQPLPLPTAHPDPTRHCGIGRTGTHHWRYSVSIVWGHTLYAFSSTHGGVACAPKWA